MSNTHITTFSEVATAKISKTNNTKGQLSERYTNNQKARNLFSYTESFTIIHQEKHDIIEMGGCI